MLPHLRPHTRLLAPLLSFGVSLTGGVTAAAQTLLHPEGRYDAPGGLFDADSLRTLEVDFYDADFDARLDASWTADAGLRLPARLTLRATTGAVLAVVDSAGVRYKGNSTYALAREVGNPKLPLNIDVDAAEAGADLLGYDKLKLANAYLDPTLTREVVAYGIYRRYLPAPEANLLRVVVNGTYRGVYVNTEPVDGAFTRKHFGDGGGALVKCDPVQQFGQDPDTTGRSDLAYLGPDSTAYFPSYDVKSDTGWRALVRLIELLEDDDAGGFAAAYDVDRWLWGFAVNMVVNNLDTYNGAVQHNYYLHRGGGGAPWQYVPWDVSESFTGAFLNQFDPAITREFSPFGNFFFNYFTPLMRALRRQPEWQRRYEHHLRVVLADGPDPEAIRRRVSALQDLSRAAVLADPNRRFSDADWVAGVDTDLVVPDEYGIAGIVNTAAARRDYLLSLEELTVDAPEVGVPTVVTRGGRWYVEAAVGDADEVRLFSGPSRERRYENLVRFGEEPMRDDGTGGDRVAGDGVYAALLTADDARVSFYVRADNAAAMTTQPARAAYDYYRFVPARSDAVVVNEVLASNEATLADAAGEFDDWIELHNPTTAAVAIGGLTLSDDPARPGKWALPDTSIAPGGYLLVWADEDGAQGPLHANFKLSASAGERVGLYRPDGSLIEEVDFGPQDPDVSWARLPDADGPFAAAAPTPGARNAALVDLTEAESATRVLAWPNPARERLRFAPEVARGLGRTVDLLAVDGRRIELPVAGAGASLAGVPAGLYLLRVTTAAGQQLHQRLVVAR